MLVSIDGAEPIRLQGAYASEKDTTPFIVHLKQAAGGAGCDETILAQIHAEIEKCKNDGKPSAQELADKSIFEDQRFIEACLVAIESGKASTSLLQRHCSLGYGRAAKYIDVMEYMGIITPPAGAKPREVLMTRDQFMELVAREGASGD
jgi:S-DNA-T family DNA segregation ATPase FtsK/SpoIIIE